MSFMFCNCLSLKEFNLDLNNFNANNLKNMRCMLCQCPIKLKKKIKRLNLNLKGEAFEDY